jgi:hypothetical protein
MQAHEVAQRLLAEQSLSLHVDLADRLPGETLRLYDLFPLANSELHESQLEDGHLLALPAGR